MGPLLSSPCLSVSRWMTRKRRGGWSQARWAPGVGAGSVSKAGIPEDTDGATRNRRGARRQRMNSAIQILMVCSFLESREQILGWKISLTSQYGWMGGWVDEWVDRSWEWVSWWRDGWKPDRKCGQRHPLWGTRVLVSQFVHGWGLLWTWCGKTEWIPRRQLSQALSKQSCLPCGLQSYQRDRRFIPEWSALASTLQPLCPQQVIKITSVSWQPLGETAGHTRVFKIILSVF